MLSFPSQLDRPGVVEKTDPGDGKSLAWTLIYIFSTIFIIALNNACLQGES